MLTAAERYRAARVAARGIGSTTSAAQPVARGVQVPGAIAQRAVESLSPMERYRNQRIMQRAEAYGVADGVAGASTAAKFMNQVPEGVRNRVGGALRGIASALEPLQLPQDMLFAVIAGTLDDKSTISSRLQQIHWREYAPGGAAPPRVASGEEIFSLMGFDETTSKWAGIAADLVADPLVAGSFLRVAGKAARSASLVRLGNKLDHFISPLGMAQEVNQFARRSKHISSFQDARMEELFRVLRNPESTVFGIENFGTKVGRASDFILPREVSLRFQLGAEVGSQIAAAERASVAVGSRLASEAVHALQRAKYGTEGRFFEELTGTYLKAMEGQSAAFEKYLADLPSQVRDVIETSVYAASNAKRKIGFGALAVEEGDLIRDPALRRLAEDFQKAATTPSVHDASEKVADVITELLTTKFDDAADVWRNHVIETAGNVARRNGLAASDIEKAEQQAAFAFNSYLRDTIHIDARLGAATSGYDFISRGVRERVLELGGSLEEAEEIWLRILATGAATGSKGLKELRSMSTSLMLRTPAGTALREFERQVANRISRMNFVRSYVDDLNVAKAAEKGVRSAPRHHYEAIRMQNKFARGVETDARRAASDAAKSSLDDITARTAAAAGADAQAQAAAQASRQAMRSDMDAARADVAERVIGSLNQVLFMGADDLPERLAASSKSLRDLLLVHMPQDLRNTPLATALAKKYKQLDTAVVRYENILAKIRAKDVITEAMANRLIKAEISLVNRLTQQRDLLTQAKTIVGDITNRAGSNAALEKIPSVSRVLDNLAGLTTDVQSMVARKGRVAQDIGEYAAARKATTETIAARRKAVDEREAAAYSAHNKARAAEVTDAKALYKGEHAAYKQWETEAKARWKAEDAKLKAEYEQQRQAINAEMDARAAVKAAEREAAGLPKEGSRADLKRVAAMDPGYRPRELLREERAIPYDGYNTTEADIFAARKKKAMKDTESVTTKESPEILTDEFLARDPITYAELLDGIADMQALDLGEFLGGLMDGHLRRAYGLFIDGDGFQRYIDRLRSGGLVSSKILDEGNLRSYLGTGFEQEASLLQDYISSLQKARGGAAVVLRRDNMVEHLLQSGVSGRRANEVMMRLHAGVTNNSQFEKMVDIVIGKRNMYRGEMDLLRVGSPASVRNTRVFEDRVNMDPDLMNMLGEHAMASMSLVEQAGYAQRVVKRQEYLQEVYRIAQRYGLIKNGEFKDSYGTFYRQFGSDLSENALGGFAGKYLHPHLIKELERFSQVKRDFLPAGFQRLRALVTGGYLAAPAVLAANMMGGFYQGWTAGINPVVMLRRMGEVLPDMIAASRGRQTEFMRAVRANGDVELTGLVNNNMRSDFERLVAVEAGLGPEGFQKMADHFASTFEDFLQRPGIGKIRADFAGLSGFQFTENWFKVAAFKEMQSRLGREGLQDLTRGTRTLLNQTEIDRLAGEFARTVVFDYSQLPTSLEFMKKTGLVLFPGFPYFLAGRTVGAVLQRPGVVAISDRVSEALMNASLPVEDQILAYIGMQDYLKEDQGSPLPFSVRYDEDGNKMVSMIPLAQLIPTQTIWDGPLAGNWGTNPWGESITQLGMWGPLVDVMSAIIRGDGEAPLTGQFGHHVFDPGSEGAEKAANIFRFLYNTMAPSVVRKTLRQGYDQRWQGVLPAIPRAIQEWGNRVPEDFIQGVYTIGERRLGRPEQGWREDVIASVLRTPQVVALEGPLAGIRRALEGERNDLNARLAPMNQYYQKARAEGREAYADNLKSRILELRSDHNARWADFLEFNNAYAERRRREREAQP